MDIMDLFLNELQKRISANETIIHDFESKKNDILQAKNIFYNYDLINQSLSLDTLLSLSYSDVKFLICLLDSNQTDSINRTYLVYKSLVESYQDLVKKYGKDFEAPQYHEAVKWLNDLVDKINIFIDTFEKRNEEYISELKEDTEYYKKYYNSFNGGILVKPIEDLDDFDNLLEKLSFGDYEKWQIKKEVGTSLIDLSKDAGKKIVIDSTALEKELDEFVISDESTISGALEPVKQSDPLVDEVGNILQVERELIDNVDEEAFNEYLAQSINSNDKNAIKYQIVSILIALHNELEKYKNTLDIPRVNKSYEENIREYIEVYKSLKGKI